MSQCADRVCASLLRWAQHNRVLLSAAPTAHGRGWRLHAYSWLRVVLVAIILHGQQCNKALPRPTKQAETHITLAVAEVCLLTTHIATASSPNVISAAQRAHHHYCLAFSYGCIQQPTSCFLHCLAPSVSFMYRPSMTHDQVPLHSFGVGNRQAVGSVCMQTCLSAVVVWLQTI